MACITCKREYETPAGGWVCLDICPDCLKKPRAPDQMLSVNGIFRPNPAYEVWKESEAERIQQLRSGDAPAPEPLVN